MKLLFAVCVLLLLNVDAICPPGPSAEMVQKDEDTLWANMTNQEKFEHFGKTMLTAGRELDRLTEEDVTNPRVILRQETEQSAFRMLAVGKNFLRDKPLHAVFNTTQLEKLKDFGAQLTKLEKGLASKGLL
jgi:hypothetical protein